jgi:hypothetical protein
LIQKTAYYISKYWRAFGCEDFSKLSHTKTQTNSQPKKLTCLSQKKLKIQI